MEHGLRAWLADENIKEGERIFEGVRTALTLCDGMMIMVTRHSLGSAWVDTEIQTALGLMAAPGSKAKPVLFVVDASDAPLMDLLASWDLDKDRPFDPNLLEPLWRSFARVETNEHRCQVYRQNAAILLHQMKDERFRLAAYPQRPLHWKGRGRFEDFRDAVQALPLPDSSRRTETKEGPA